MFDVDGRVPIWEQQKNLIKGFNSQVLWGHSQPQRELHLNLLDLNFLTMRLFVFFALSLLLAGVTGAIPTLQVSKRAISGSPQGSS